MKKVRIARGAQDILHDRLKISEYNKEFELVAQTKYVSVVSDGEKEYTFKNEYVIK